jgi:pimeloyl-ACP methyl ester carboxylesterase
MPFAVNRGCRIAFDVIGEGSTVVLQGGLTSRKLDVARLGYVDAFSDGYQVVNVDSLGHGDSDKPFDCTSYAAAQRAADVAAVLDVVGVDRAHVLGYSMGGWITSAMLIHCPDRLSSAIIGGWDPCPPPSEGVEPRLDFDELMAFARREVPEQMSWITAAVEPAVRCCWQALEDVQDIEPALAGFDRPVLLWKGAEDGAREPTARLAAAYELVQLLETPGDHMSAWFNDDGAAKRALRNFVDAAEARVAAYEIDGV